MKIVRILSICMLIALVSGWFIIAFGRYRGNTLLMYASAKGLPTFGHFLLAIGANPNAWSTPASTPTHGETYVPDPDFYASHTPLMIATRSGQPGMVALLVLHGATINAVDEQDMTPLTHAVYSSSGSIESIRILLEHGAKLQGLGFPALIVYAAAGRKEAIEMLVERGVDVNVRSEDGRTAVIAAAANHKCEVAKFLVRNGANPSMQDNRGLTGLDLLNACDRQ